MQNHLKGALILLFCLPLLAFAGKLERGFEALKKFDFFSAKELFEKVKEKEPAGANYGLSLIFGKNQNPFYNLDSAYIYVSKAEEAYKTTEDKEKEDLAELNVNAPSIASWKDSIDYKIFQQIVPAPNLPQLQKFIERHKDANQRPKAIAMRDSIAFGRARSENTAEAYKQFYLTYPDASQVYEAQNRFEQQLYLEETSRGNLPAYKQFIRKYPESPYVRRAQDSIYTLSTRAQTVEAYHEFIRSYPDHPRKNEAWRNLYRLYTADFSPQRIIEFRIDYPAYPFLEELKVDMKLAAKSFYPFRENELYGFMDEEGKVMIDPTYTSVEEFQEGLALVVKNGKVGYIDKNGDVVIPYEYSDGESFQNGLAIVAKNDLYGMIDRTNKAVVPLKYEVIGPFNSGLAVVGDEKAYGYVNKQGKEVIPITLEYAKDFQDGYALIEMDGKKGIINTLGKLVVPAIYDFLDPFNRYGLSRAKKDSLFGLLNTNGAAVLPFEYDHIGEFSNGLALVNQGGKYGYTDRVGKLIIPLRYDFLPEALVWGNFEGNYTKFYSKGKYGIINNRGEEVFPAIFEEVGQYHEKLPVAVKKRGQWGYSDQKLNLQIPYKYDFAESFRYGYGKVRQEDQWGLLNQKGKEVLPLEHEEVKLHDSTAIVIKKAGAYGLLDAKLDTLLPLNYQSIKSYKNELLQLTTDSTSIYYHIPRRQLLKPKSE
jgi:hypothetical protein